MSGSLHVIAQGHTAVLVSLIKPVLLPLQQYKIALQALQRLLSYHARIWMAPRIQTADIWELMFLYLSFSSDPVCLKVKEDSFHS